MSQHFDIVTVFCTPKLLILPKDHPPTPRGTWINFGETRGGVRKSGVLQHESGNISDKAHCAVSFAIAQLSCIFYRASPALA